MTKFNEIITTCPGCGTKIEPGITIPADTGIIVISVPHEARGGALSTISAIASWLAKMDVPIVVPTFHSTSTMRSGCWAEYKKTLSGINAGLYIVSGVQLQKALNIQEDDGLFCKAKWTYIPILRATLPTDEMPGTLLYAMIYAGLFLSGENPQEIPRKTMQLITTVITTGKTNWVSRGAFCAKLEE